MNYNFEDKELVIPESVVQRQIDKKALKMFEDNLTIGLEKATKPVEDLLSIFIKEVNNNEDFKALLLEKDQQFRTGLLSLVKEQGTMNKESFSKFKSEISKIVTELINDREIIRSVSIKNIDKMPTPLEEMKISNIREGVQAVKVENYPDPTVVNVTEKVVEFPVLQDVNLKNKKIDVNIVNKEQKIRGKVEISNKKFPIELSKSQLKKLTPVKDVNAKVSFAELKKIIQKVRIENPVEKISVSNLDEINLNVPSDFEISNLPIAKGQKPSVKNANPEIYIPIRLTDGKNFIDNLSHPQNMMSGGPLSSSLPESWTTTSGSVNIVSRNILEANDMRKLVVLTNDSVETIYLSFGEDAKLGAGIRLNARGGAYEINKENMFKGNIFAISNTDANNISILEVFKVLDY